MRVEELSRQYRESGEACRARAAALRRKLADGSLSRNDRYALSVRIQRLEEMATGTLSTAGFLARYYR